MELKGGMSGGIPRNDITVGNPTCKECGFVHPPDPSGKCPIKNPKVSSGSKSSIKTDVKGVDDFLIRLKEYFKTAPNADQVVEGICKILNI